MCEYPQSSLPAFKEVLMCSGSFLRTDLEFSLLLSSIAYHWPHCFCTNAACLDGCFCSGCARVVLEEKRNRGT